MMWEVGKVRVGPESDRLELRQWTDWELQKTLQAWDQLLDAIEARMDLSSGSNLPRPSSSQSQYDASRPLGLVSAELLGRYCPNGFTRAFLQSARHPLRSKLFIAPGITAFIRHHTKNSTRPNQMIVDGNELIVGSAYSKVIWSAA